MEKPWIKNYDPKMTQTIECPEKTLYQMLLRTVERFPNRIAMSFEGTHLTYDAMLKEVNQIASALTGLGMRETDVLTICLPNIPQAAIAFYAANKLGLICNMVHPKTPASELSDFMNSTGSKYIVILDAFMHSRMKAFEENKIAKVIAAQIGDYLNPLKSTAFYLAKGRKIPAMPQQERYLYWKELLKKKNPIQTDKLPSSQVTQSVKSAHEPAVYLHSGGTTGIPKTIVLSSHNMNMLAVAGPQFVNIDDPFATGILPELSMVTILPLFHGFGLCMGLHTMICNGIRSILVPLFTPDTLAKVIRKEKPSFIAAVPTLYEGMMKSPKLERADLSCLKACFCGGDVLTADLKDRFEQFIAQRGAKLSLREGYGLTETVTVCCVNPEYKSKPGSIGLPLPGIEMKIIDVSTKRTLSSGKKGEICVSGPTIMLGYLNDEETTNQTIKLDEDGKRWVHTGDYGHMDSEGYFYFTQRLKRIIKVSGIPVFPSQIEDAISKVSGVDSVCAISIPDPYRMAVVKAIVILDKEGLYVGEEEMRHRIVLVCKDHLIPYARPVEIEFRSDLPKTLVGKIDYVLLEQQEKEKKNPST